MTEIMRRERSPLSLADLERLPTDWYCSVGGFK
jgi:hypothetical protein